jgi:hypothetical protein
VIKYKPKRRVYEEHQPKGQRLICANCDKIFDVRKHDRCPHCGRDVIPDELQEAQNLMEQTYRERGLQGSIDVIRPLMNAVVETVVTLAPMFPRSQLQAAMNETAVFTLLCELEARGFRVVPIERTIDSPAATERVAAS